MQVHAEKDIISHKKHFWPRLLAQAKTGTFKQV